MQDDHTTYALNEISTDKVMNDRELANRLRNGNNLYMQSKIMVKESQLRNIAIGVTAGAITPLLAAYAIYRTNIPKQPGISDDLTCIVGALVSNLGPILPFIGYVGGGILVSAAEAINHEKKINKTVRRLEKFVQENTTMPLEDREVEPGINSTIPMNYNSLRSADHNLRN